MNFFIGKFYDTASKWHWSWQIIYMYATRIIEKMGEASTYIIMIPGVVYNNNS